MPKQPLPRISEGLKDVVYNAVCDFGCVRRRTLVKYACIVIRESDYIKDEYKPRSVEIADQILQSLELNKRIKTAKVANESIVIPTHGELDYTAMECFEAFVAIIEEMSKKNVMFWACHAMPAGHPFDFVIGTPETTYRVIVYGSDAISKINFMNVAYKKSFDRDFTTLFIVTDAYAGENFNDLDIMGCYRLAFIMPDGKDMLCVLSEPIGKQITQNDQIYI